MRKPNAGKHIKYWLAVLLLCLTAAGRTVFGDSGDDMLAGSAALLDRYSRSQEETQASETQTAEETAASTEAPETSAETSEASGASEASSGADATEASAGASEEETEETLSAEDQLKAEKKAAKKKAKKEALASYDNLGIVDVGDNYLNVREKPGKNKKIVGRMRSGYACEILGKKGKWYHIVSGSVEGYVHKKYLLTGEEAEEAALDEMELRVQINTETLNVRSEPSEDADIWTQVDGEETYSIESDQGEWIEIELDNSTGYVAYEYVTYKYTLEKAVKFEEKEEEESSLRDKIVSYAMKYLGNPYVWGGESLTKGCDCSGFTMLIFRHFGISLPHYSVSQAQKGREVSSDEKQPGDLIFYAKNGKINHVAIYIGNGQVIGAQSVRRGIAVRNWNYRTPVKIVNVID